MLSLSSVVHDVSAIPTGRDLRFLYVRWALYRFAGWKSREFSIKVESHHRLPSDYYRRVSAATCVDSACDAVFMTATTNHFVVSALRSVSRV